MTTFLFTKSQSMKVGLQNRISEDIAANKHLIPWGPKRSDFTKAFSEKAASANSRLRETLSLERCAAG